MPALSSSELQLSPMVPRGGVNEAGAQALHWVSTCISMDWTAGVGGVQLVPAKAATHPQAESRSLRVLGRAMALAVSPARENQ